MSDLETALDTEALAENTGLGISEDKQQEMASYLLEEFNLVYNGEDREDFMSTLDRIKRDRIAKPDQDSKSVPWNGSSNVKPPITMQKVNTVYAKMLNNIFADDKLFAFTALDETICDQVADFEQFFNDYVMAPSGMNIKEKIKAPLYDLVSLGSTLTRIPWIKEEVTFKGKDGSELIQTRRKGPQLEYTPLHNFCTRAQWVDVQRCPWVGVLHNFTAADLRLQVRRGYFDAKKVEEVLGLSAPLGDQDTDDHALIGIDPKTEMKGHADGNFEVIEGWLLWDAEADGLMNECKLHIERTTGTVLRAEYNPLGKREIALGRYMLVPSELYGLGIGHICLSTQAEITAAHNMRINFMQLVLSPPLKYRNGSNLDADLSIYPGMTIGLDDMSDVEWMVIPPGLADIAIQTEMMAMGSASQATGASEILTGQSDQTLKSGGGAQANQQLAAQSSSVLNASQINVAQWISESGQIALEQFVLHNDDVEDLVAVYGPQKAASIMSILAIPLDQLPTKLRFSVKLAEMDKSDQAEMQRAQIAYQLYQTYTQSAMQLQQVIGMANQPGAPGPNGQPSSGVPQNVLMAAQQAWAGNTKLMSNIFKVLGITYPDQYFPSAKMELKALEAMDQMKNTQVEKALSEGGMTNEGTTPTEPEFGGDPSGPVGAGGPGGAGGAPGAGMAQAPQGESPAGFEGSI